MQVGVSCRQASAGAGVRRSRLAKAEVGGGYAGVEEGAGWDVQCVLAVAIVKGEAPGGAEMAVLRVAMSMAVLRAAEEWPGTDELGYLEG